MVFTHSTDRVQEILKILELVETQPLDTMFFSTASDQN